MTTAIRYLLLATLLSGGVQRALAEQPDGGIKRSADAAARSDAGAGQLPPCAPTQ